MLFHHRIRLYYPSLDLYHHYLGTPVRGQFFMYIRALRATLNQTDRSFNSVSLYKSASYMSFVIPAWLTGGTPCRALRELRAELGGPCRALVELRAEL